MQARHCMPCDLCAPEAESTKSVRLILHIFSAGGKTMNEWLYTILVSALVWETPKAPSSYAEVAEGHSSNDHRLTKDTAPTYHRREIFHERLLAQLTKYEPEHSPIKFIMKPVPLRAKTHFLKMAALT